MSSRTGVIPTLLLSVLFATASACAAPQPPPAQVAESRYTPAQLREDFDALYSGLQAAHYDLYARRSKAEYDALYRRMHAELYAPFTAAEARIRFQRFAAYGRVAHARVELPSDTWETYRSNGGKAFPLFLRFADGRAYVQDDISGAEAVDEGDELLTVAGLPVRDWLAPVRALVSADNDYLNETQLETRLPLLVWLAHGEHATFAVAVRKPDGRRIEATVAARSRADYTAAIAARPPRFELDWNAREARMLGDGVAYLRPGPFYDNRPDAATPWDPAAFKTFIDQAFADFIEHDARSLLIDLRDNPGGDNSFSDHLLAWIADKPFRFTNAFDIRISEQTTASNRKRLDSTGGDSDSMSAKFDALYAGKPPGSRVTLPMPWVQPRAERRFEGRVFVLMNRHSYSNTVSVASIVQDYGFGTVLGEETADLASTYGAMENFALPQTGIEVGYPKARILRPNGDAHPRGVIPDIVIATPLLGGKDDAVLTQAIKTVSQRGHQAPLPSSAATISSGSGS
jgi:C-terminal processing protease CtpA/Prc